MNNPTGVHHHHYPDSDRVTDTVVFHNHSEDTAGRGYGTHDHDHPYYMPCARDDCIMRQFDSDSSLSQKDIEDFWEEHRT